MKAIVFICACILALTFNAHGQEKGNWSLTFSAMPTIDWAGNTLNGTGDNFYHPEEHLLNHLNTQGIMIKNQNGTNGMHRYFLGMNSSSMTVSNDVYDDLSNSPNDLVTDSKSVSSSAVALGYGIERFQGEQFRLKYGMDFTAIFGSGENASYTYGNSFGEGNSAPISTSWSGTSVVGETPQAMRLSSSSTGSYVGFSASPFVGAEYFLKEKISLGIEFHLMTTLYSTMKPSSEVYTSYEPVSQSLYQSTINGQELTMFNATPALMGGGLLFTIYL